MSSGLIGFEAAKKSFFNPHAVMSVSDRAAQRMLSKFGAFVRTRAQSSIKYRKGVSEPGSAPSAHRSMQRPETSKAKVSPNAKQTVSPLKQFLFFSKSEDGRSVVIGPALLNAKLSEVTLKALEHGGPSFVSKGRGTKKTIRPITVRARPFMQPALEAESPRMPQLFVEAFRRAA